MTSIDTVASLKPGMYVRIPLDTEDTPIVGEHREFRAGQVVSLNENDGTVQVRLIIHDYNPEIKKIDYEIATKYVRRCPLPEGISFASRTAQAWGTILAACKDEFELGIYREYYVHLNGEVCIVSEADMVVASHFQDVSPLEQLANYEFHNPIWKGNRDALLEACRELNSSTYGIEDLVGARVILMAHQAEVVARVLSDTRGRFILADEVGLGKTIEACVILKGLRRREPELRTLIITPPSLKQQWHNELNRKFWLDFHVVQEPSTFRPDVARPGIIISISDLNRSQDLYAWMRLQQWGLLIVDEAHNLHKNPELSQLVKQLSQEADRALILSATPIIRRAEEYLSLLRLMDPARYELIDPKTFQNYVENQRVLRDTVSYLRRGMTSSDFDPDEFCEEIEKVSGVLNHDNFLRDLIAQVDRHEKDKGRRIASNVLSYVSENYRIENRVIRNRRASLNINLPQRTVDESYAYYPEGYEQEVTQLIHDTVNPYLDNYQDNLRAVAFGALLFQGAFSSPSALLRILRLRQAVINGIEPASVWNTPRFPYLKLAEAFETITQAPSLIDEAALLQRIIWLAEQWENQLSSSLRDYPSHPDLQRNYSERLLQAAQAIHYALSQPSTKVIVFSSWWDTLVDLIPIIARNFGIDSFAEFHSFLSANKDLQAEADRFQGDERCRIIFCDELGGEGRNFQIADQVIHLDLPWAPSEIEQRIGRIDRLGRNKEVLSIVPFSKDTLEHDLYAIWQHAFELFTQSISGLEIMLEDIQDQIMAAFGASSRQGLADLLPSMTDQAISLRREVERERYFEEIAINRRRRDDFSKIVERYQEGAEIRAAVLNWAEIVGLYNDYYSDNEQVIFTPEKFRHTKMEKAKFGAPAQMQEALKRSRREHDLRIKGTFNRRIAVQREDLVFFAPGEEWTDSIILNALICDKGRSAAFALRCPNLDADWDGFEFIYGISIDPRPLYQLGLQPNHLFRAQGFLSIPTYRTVIGLNGKLLKYSDPRYQVIQKEARSKDKLIHLGERDVQPSPLLEFKQQFPPNIWSSIVQQAYNQSLEELQEVLAITEDLANEAQQDFDQFILGHQAAFQWFTSHGIQSILAESDILLLEQSSQALLEGLRKPRFRLESATFWSLRV